MASKKILIVDDDTSFLELLQDYFKSMGYDVRTAGDAESGMDIFKRHRPRVVLLDFNMPLITGEKFLPVLQGVDPMIKAIVISGCIEEEVEEKFRGLGYFAFFEKGKLSLEILKEKVDEALNY